MAPQLKRPILLGGVGLATGLWLLESMSSLPAEGGFGFTGLLALSAGAWWLKQRATAESEPVPELRVPQIDRAMVDGAIAQTQTTLTQLEAEIAAAQDSAASPSNAESQTVRSPEFDALQARLKQLTADLDRQELRFALLGGQAVGKTTLAHTLAKHWRPKSVSKIRFMDTPQLFALELGLPGEPASTAETSSIEKRSIGTQPVENWTVPQSVLGADLLLFVTAGDITETERRCLAWLKGQAARLIVVVNKQDLHLPEQQAQVLAQVRQNLKEILPTGDVVAIAAQPAPIRRVRQDALKLDPSTSAPSPAQAENNSSPLQSLTQPDPNLALLLDRLNQLIIAEPAQELTWATACHSANAMAEEAKALLNQLRRRRASKVIDQYQWVAAGAAFINPVPTLDLLATGAVNSQLILDLSKIYRQPLSTDHAKTMATTLAEMLIKLGLVEVSSKMLGIALKTNGATYVAGGLIQGASAAYLTRTVGSSLMEYFEVLEVAGELPQSQSMEQLKQIVQRVFTASRQSPALQRFARQAIGKLTAEPVAEPITDLVAEPTVKAVAQPSN